MTATVSLQAISAERILVPIIGTAPLIVHAWSAKAKRKMLDAQQGRKAPKEVRDPQADYEASLYRTKDGGYGFPTLAFKAATVGAARYFGKSVTMVQARQCLFVRGVPSSDQSQILTAIEGIPRMREDMVSVGASKGPNELRYRGEFTEWRAVVDFTYVSTMLDRGSVLSLIDAGGMGVGIGEWRPEKGGAFGTYAVDATRDVEVVK